jgi:thiamine-phosphate pyrophosphorylase
VIQTTVARPGFVLYLITDRKAVRSGDLVSACDAALSAARDGAPPGAVALQLREKDLAGRELYELALRMREVCRRAGAPMLVNDRVDVAMAADADGVHLPFSSMGPGAARKLLGPDKLIGVSAHSLPDVMAAGREGADFTVFGPVFPPISKSAYGPATGTARLTDVCRSARIPVFALGGITPERARALMDEPVVAARPAGVAAIGSILGADSPADAMRAMLAALRIGARKE